MERDVDGMTESAARKGWRGVFTSEGPRFSVPRVVWQASWCLFFLAAFVPLLVMLEQIPYREAFGWPEVCRAFVIAVYSASSAEASKRFLRWLYGSIRPKRGSRQIS